jgi:hypothetical protein
MTLAHIFQILPDYIIVMITHWILVEWWPDLLLYKLTQPFFPTPSFTNCESRYAQQAKKIHCSHVETNVRHTVLKAVVQLFQFIAIVGRILCFQKLVSVFFFSTKLRTEFCSQRWNYVGGLDVPCRLTVL